MKKFPTITIGIPAYNEEANIEHLLQRLIADNSKAVKLLEVIVVSDGSTDKTVTLSKSVKDNRIRVIDRKKRLGLVGSENEILKYARGDYLVMLDADVIPVEPDFLDRITAPFRTNKSVGCVGAATIPLPPRNIFERVIANSHYMKQYMYKKINSGNNVYLCHGRARAFAKNFYQKFTWADNCPEDAYSYFACLSQGFKFVYAGDAGVYFRSPQNFTEHASQSTRFLAGIRRLKAIFDPALIEREYTIPAILFIKTLIKYLSRNPFSMPAYIVINLIVRFMNRAENSEYISKYTIALSSKQVVLYRGQKLSRV